MFLKKTLSIFVIITTLIIISVNGLKCPKCNSATSWADCTGDEILSDCNSSNDMMCFKVRMTREYGKVYQKDCTKREYCSKERICSGSTSYCDLECCTGDGCTSGSYHLQIQIWLTVAMVILTCKFLLV